MGNEINNSKKKKIEDKVEKENENGGDRTAHLKDLYSEHGSILTRDSQFFGYGILSALFLFGQDFFEDYKFWALTTALFSIATLLLIYLYSVLIFLLSKDSLELKNELTKKKDFCSEDCIREASDYLYRKKRPLVMFIFWLFQITLIFSVILFIRSAYLFFYGSCA